MSLDPTHSEVFFRTSVKKFLVDNLYTTDGIYIDFNKIYESPSSSSDDRWIRFHFDGLSARGIMSVGRVAAYLFTRQDNDGMKLASLRDTLYKYLVDLTMPDGLRRVPLYDDSWDIIGGMIVTVGNESKEEFADDDTLYKFVNIYFKYAIT